MTFLNINKLIGFGCLLVVLASCSINSNMMFKTPKDGSFKYDSIPLRPLEAYTISVDDKLAFELSTNGGKNLVEALSGTHTENSTLRQDPYYNGNNSTIKDYLVKNDGYVELPVLGNLYVVGLTISQFQDTLEKLFSSQYQKPFIQARITNQRCIIFPGNGSDAKIIEIKNNNTTLMEVIAMSGGIPSRGRAKIIKVMRRTKGKREIYHIDVSTIDGLKYADMIIQGNDYIYIEPTPQIVRGLLSEIAPVASLISSAVILYSIFSKL